MTENGNIIFLFFPSFFPFHPIFMIFFCYNFVLFFTSGKTNFHSQSISGGNECYVSWNHGWWLTIPRWLFRAYNIISVSPPPPESNLLINILEMYFLFHHCLVISRELATSSLVLSNYPLDFKISPRSETKHKPPLVMSDEDLDISSFYTNKIIHFEAGDTCLCCQDWYQNVCAHDSSPCPDWMVGNRF